MLPRICLTEMGFHATAQTVQNFQPEEDENHIMLTKHFYIIHIVRLRAVQ